MNIRKPLILGASIAALLGAMALPASADDTDATFTLTGGELTLSVAATAALTDAASGTTAISGSLGPVSVTDERGGIVVWNVSAASTAFTGDGGSSSTTVSYTGGAVAETGTITVADGLATVIDTVESVVSPSALSGNNTASWSPTLGVTMLPGALADDYTGTVTTSIL
jgi:hypothetical protein